MKKLFARLELSPGFLLFIILFSYLDSIRARIAPGQLINAYTFTPEAVIIAIPQVLIIVLLLRFFFQKIHGDSFPFQWGKALLGFVTGLIAWVLISNLITLLISLAFGNVARNFIWEIVMRNNFSNALDFLVYGGFYFAFLLFRKFQNHQRILAEYDHALSESAISQLKQQLDPHFLFNNLNILDQLIEENPSTASEFLHDFSGLYRYVLEKSEAKLVNLEEELAFAENYFRLVAYKYGKGYQLEIRNPLTKEGLIPPLTLQLLIENAVFHNQGNATDPIFITIEVGDRISVSNQIRLYKYKKHRGGRGLENLRKQFNLLGNERLEVIQTSEHYTVILPIINLTKK